MVAAPVQVNHAQLRGDEAMSEKSRFGDRWDYLLYSDGPSDKGLSRDEMAPQQGQREAQ